MTASKNTSAQKSRVQPRRTSKKALASAALSPELITSLYKSMLRIRRFEERTAELFDEGLIKGTAHSYIGQEAIAVGVCSVLSEKDYVGSYHRGHGHCISKGADLGAMMAELMGRSTGYCKGLGGSMHIADLSLGILGANGIVGAAMPICSGAALASRLRESGQVAVAFFGDGASNQGIFHETLNLAAVWQLPLVFVCENNQYALTTPYQRTTAGASIAERATPFGIPNLTVDGNDVEAVHDAAKQAVERARNGGGPTFIEALTYRWGQHSMRANLADPRPDEEIQRWIERDPLIVAKRKILDAGASAIDLDEINETVLQEIEAAVAFGKSGSHPTLSDALGSIYAERTDYPEPELTATRELSFTDAINEALSQEMSSDDSVFLMGEDIGETGGIFQTTKGLLDLYGPERVRDTPISEATFVGCGVGAAIVGMRPVIELQIFDFVTVAMDMIVNQAAKLRFMLGGRATVPLVVRGPHGAGIRLAAQHSQSLEAWFTHIPGLVVVAPSSAHDAKGLLISSIRENNPVIFLESKLLYLSPPSPVPTQSYAIPLGKGIVKREGADVTVVATMAMVPRALAAAELLSKDGISVEVIDPRTLHPLDEDLIIESVKKTNRLVIAHEACTQFGFGAEVLSLVVEKAFDWLDAPVARVGAPSTPMPYADALEREVIPSQQRIVDAIRQVMK